MIGYLKSKADNEDVFKVINPVVGSWFKSKFKGFSDPQRYAIIPIHNKENILVSAVTGSGKTLTAFTSILSELITLSENDLLENQIYAVYISPLKALSNDIHFNLEQPLKEMEAESKKDFNIKVAVRTGDTTQSEKSKMLRRSPHILITTPESFSIVLTSPKLKEKLRSVKWVIIDEIHALAESKRGVHLSLALERLEDLSQNFTRIGLSATAEPIEDIAKFLVGSKRKCKIAKVELKKNMDIKVLSPVPDLINVTHKQMHNEMYDLIDNLIQEHKTTLVFTNTRSATERVVHHLKERFPKKYTENSIKNIDYKEIVEVGQSYIKGELSDSNFVLNMSTFEYWLLDELKTLISYSPVDFYPNDKKQIEISCLKTFRDLTVLWNELIDDYLRSLPYKGMKEELKTFLKAFQFKESDFMTDLLDKISESSLLRNIIIHNQKKVNSSYIKKSGKFGRFSDGDIAVITVEIIYDQADNLLRFMQDFRKNLESLGK